MSDYDREKGTISEIEIQVDLESTMVEILGKHNIVLKEDADVEDEFNEFCYDGGSNKYILINGRIFEFLKYESFGSDCDFEEGKYDKDGNIEFHVNYYNGGACLVDILESLLEKLEGECN